jgi:hypothetical protein
MSEPHKISEANWTPGYPTKNGAYWLASKHSRPLIGYVENDMVKFLAYDRWQRIDNELPGITHYMEIEHPKDI